MKEGACSFKKPSIVKPFIYKQNDLAFIHVEETKARCFTGTQRVSFIRLRFFKVQATAGSVWLQTIERSIITMRLPAEKRSIMSVM